MGSALSEALLLRDVHRWAVGRSVDYLNELDQTLALLARRPEVHLSAQDVGANLSPARRAAPRAADTLA